MDYPDIRDLSVLRFSMRVTATFVRVRCGNASSAPQGEFHFMLPAGVEPFISVGGELQLRKRATGGEPIRVSGQESAPINRHADFDRTPAAGETPKLAPTGTGLDTDWLARVGAGLKHGFAELFSIPEAQAQLEEEPNRRIGPGGIELSPIEESLFLRFHEAIKELREIDPNSREATYVTGPNYVPDETTVLRVEWAVRAARSFETDRSTLSRNT